MAAEKYSLAVMVWGNGKYGGKRYLSVTSKTPIPEKEMRKYQEDWAINNQHSFGRVAIVQFNSDGKEIFKIASDAEMNYPRKSNPKTAAKKTSAKTGVRRVALVGVNPSRVSRNLAAPKPKKKEVWPRYVVSELQGRGPWMYRAGFHKREDAEEYARAIHNANPEIGVKVSDSKS